MNRVIIRILSLWKCVFMPEKESIVWKMKQEVFFLCKRQRMGTEIFIFKDERSVTESIVVEVIGADDTVYHVRGNVEYRIQI